MTLEKYLTYRGEIRGIVGSGGGDGSTLAFVTSHLEEGHPAALYRLDADKLTLTSEPLPQGGLALVADGETLWISGGEGQLYEATTGSPRPRGGRLEAPASALATLADGRIAALVGSKIVILGRRDGRLLQTLELPEAGTALAADPTGRWLACGTTKGTVAVFDAEAKDNFALSATSQLHEAAVNAILFEPDDLRFFSTGADLKLLSTHARGKLEPEDKGRANNHADLVPALIWGPAERLYSGSRDGSIKSWPRAGGVKPGTTKDGVGRVVGLAIVTVHDRPRLVAACEDNSLRFFPIDPTGKIGELSTRVQDAYAKAKSELLESDAPLREAAIQALAGHGDARSLELIAEQIGADADHTLRLLAAEILAASAHPKALTLLEASLNHRDEAVRVAIFQGLRRQLGTSSLQPIDLALKTDRANIGKLAVEALEPLAKTDDQALARLINALDAKTSEVRLSALVVLESAYDRNSPEANLLALGSKHVDVRRAALIRLFRRKLLDNLQVTSALRRRLEDSDPNLRRTAFLLTLEAYPRLLQALRTRDPELRRQLLELEGATPETSTPAPSKKGKPPAESPLEEADIEPLLQASAARALDTCLRGALGLAILGDTRAFGLLLQLSREDDTAARAEVCRGMAALDDPRAIERLRSMLHDPEAEVRDAAFTALTRIHQAEPLVAAESGLNASHDDVRRRALQLLVAEARQAPGREPVRLLLARVLNDSFPSVRSEAFKSVLSLKIGGDAAGTLRFAGRSIHADIRREVLTEVMAQVLEPWGLDLLLEFFNDPDTNLRAEAFAFTLKKSKGLEFLDAALGSRYADLRMKAVEGLIKKHTPASQTLLVRALDDEDRAVRLAALTSLVDLDAQPALTRALQSLHADVRLRAAKALARHGDPKAFDPLTALVITPEPEEKERQADWLSLTESAIDGLGELSDPASVPSLIPLLDSPHGTIRREATLALARVSTPDRLDPLRQALQHDDPEVKYRAAYGLACLGDASVASLVFSEAGGRIISVGGQMAAALALGTSGEERLVVFLDHPKDEVRNRALLLLMMREWKDFQGTAARCLACLSSRTPRLRLTAARAIEVLSDPVAFPQFVAQLVNDKGDKPDWKIPEATIDGLAEMLIHGGPRLQSRTARLLRHLDANEQDAFNLAWSVHEARFAKDLVELRAQSKKRKPLPLQYTVDQLQDLAFGAYVGLVREQTASKAGGPDPQSNKVRQSALAHLLKLAGVAARHARSALPVVIQAMGDPNQAVRSQAFEQAQILGMPPTRLAAEALASGYLDLGVCGLELLAGEASDAQGTAVLEQAMLTRKDDLAIEAAKLLMVRLGRVTVGTRVLDAANEKVRREGVAWLAADYDQNPEAREPLRRAPKSRYASIREASALALATKKDSAAFEALVGLLNLASEPKAQRRAIQAIETLGDSRSPDALLDRVINDPAGTALEDDLIKAAGRFYDLKSADRLVALMQKEPRFQSPAFVALRMVSGDIQDIVDPDEKLADDRWVRDQRPRSDALLARMLGLLSAPADASLLTWLLPGARWARSKAVDPPLAALANHPSEKIRHVVLEALGWRLRKRDGDPEPLRKALGHRDPTTQFLAAEGLAAGGRPDGLNVLMASIDFATDLDVRRRAVRALGELADDRAFETLLKLAGEDGHALQEQAAEAIGHLGRSSRADEVFKLLDRQAKGDSGVAASALKGLRWLNSRASWQLIRDRAADPSRSLRGLAVELLGENNDPATRDLLLKLLTTLSNWGNDDSLDDALKSARRVFGLESLEPDYAILQNEDVLVVDDFDEILKRVQERGAPSKIFEILEKCSEESREPLQSCLLNRADLPIAEAKLALESPDASTAGLAGHVLGRAGAKAADAASKVDAALGRWRLAWEKQRLTFVSNARYGNDGNDLASTLTPCVQSLVWASGRLGNNKLGVLVEIASARLDDPEYRPIRREAVLALASKPRSADSLKALEAASLQGDPETRAIAAQAVARLDPKAAVMLAEQLLTDAVGFRRVTLDGKVPVETILRAASKQLHAQGVVLPALIDRGEVATLAAVAEDATLPEATRLGALEGLAAMAQEPAEVVLRKVASNSKNDEEICKAAWRLIRRSKRLRTKAGQTRTSSAGVKS